MSPRAWGPPGEAGAVARAVPITPPGARSTARQAEIARLRSVMVDERGKKHLGWHQRSPRCYRFTAARSLSSNVLMATSIVVQGLKRAPHLAESGQRLGRAQAGVFLHQGHDIGKVMLPFTGTAAGLGGGC